MPISKTKMKNAAIAAKSAALPKIPKELLDQFVSGPMTGQAVNATSTRSAAAPPKMPRWPLLRNPHLPSTQSWLASCHAGAPCSGAPEPPGRRAPAATACAWRPLPMRRTGYINDPFA